MPKIEELAREAKSLRVPMTHVPRDPEFPGVLQYRVEQEIAAAERRLSALRVLRVKTIELRQAEARV